MAATPLITALDVGKYLKIVSRGAVYNNLSEDSEIWNRVKKMKAGPAEGRENRFNLRSGYGAAAVGELPLSGGAYPSAHKSTLNEGTMVFKDYACTIELERTILQKALSDMSKYGEPLAEEIRAKTIAMSRLLSYRAYGDGTGAIGEVASSAASSNKVVVTLKSTNTCRGFVGWFEIGDKLVMADTAGTAVSPDAATAYSYMRVDDKDRVANTVTLAAINTSGAQINQSATTNIVAGTLFYRLQQSTNGSIPSVSSISADYNTLSESWCGLESLGQNDGRLVNGITLSGALGGTRFDVGGTAIDSQDFQQAMSQLMIRVGQGRYKYKAPIMAWETLDALVESRETDRRFQSIKDDKRGVEQLGYVHGKNTLIFTPDEFCRKDRIYVLPEGDVLQFYGEDFEWVNPDGKGQKFYLRPNSSGHDRVVRAYMEGSGAFFAVHPAAILTLHNFTV